MNALHFCNTSVCFFDKTPTGSIIFFEFFIVLATLLALHFFSKNDKNILAKYVIIVAGVFIFEFFTAPMWYNYHLGDWAYVYRSVSWILTIGWATLILVPSIIIDVRMKQRKVWERSVAYVLSVTVLGLIGEAIVVNLGVRSYAPETLAVINGHYMPLLNIPWKALYYIPVFMALVLSFYKYWSLLIERVLIPPIKRGKIWRNLLISALGVFLFELMIEPMVNNMNLPSWSYVYKDVSVIMTGGWIILIWISMTVIDRFFIHFSLKGKMMMYVMMCTIITLPIEAWLMINKYRMYGPSATENFSGYHILSSSIPVEVAFAIPFYLILIISFIRYWIYKFDFKS